MIRAMREEKQRLLSEAATNAASDREALRQERSQAYDAALKPSLRQVAVASEEQVVALATLCHKCAAQLDDESSASATWSRLFRAVDANASGQIRCVCRRRRAAAGAPQAQTQT